jgi:sporulation protein YlmC with PRC-barrel domain
MLRSIFKAIFVASLIAVAPAGFAQESEPGKADMEARELAAEMIGAPVSDSLGTDIGEVADISFDEEGQPDRLRVRTSSVLGFGERTVEVSRSDFMLLRGRVILEMSGDDVRSLPEVGDQIDEKRAE